MGAFRAQPPETVRDEPAALKTWKSIVPMLKRSKVLTEADAIALGSLCYDVALMQKAARALTRTSLLVQNKKTGVFHPNPLVHIVGTVAERVQRHLRDFGMTPAGRTNLQVEAADKDNDPWAEF